MNDLPHIFVGSSKEGLLIAKILQLHLEECAVCVIWNQGIAPSTYLLDAIEKELDASDFAIFVFSPDDVLYHRDHEYSAVRDNVLLEAGMFIGRLGLSRVFIVRPQDKDMRLPTDLMGVTVVTYKVLQQGMEEAALGAAATKIQLTVNTMGPKRSQEHLTRILGDRLIHQSAAVCYRVLDGKIQFLLVRTSGGNWTLPKGAIVTNEDLWRVAQANAHNEAGVRGEIDKTPIMLFRHLKGTLKIGGPILNVAAFLMCVHETFSPTETFRSPAWFDVKTAREKLTESRPFEFAQEMEKLIEKAVDEVGRRAAERA